MIIIPTHSNIILYFIIAKYFVRLFSHAILDKISIMFDGIAPNYPREFFYQLSKLQGSMSKQLIKVSADRSNDINPGNITNYRLPIGALINLDSINLWFKVSAKTIKTLPARYASTFIKRLSIQINNVSVQIIQDYNFIYNVYNDVNNKALTKGIGGDWVDNSIKWTHAEPTSAAETTIVAANAFDNANAIMTDYQLCINNFIGILGSASTKILPTDKTGEVVVSIEWAPAADVLGAVENVTVFTGASYEIDETYLTMEALSFSDDTYYNSIGDKDIKIGFNDYIYTSFAEVEKKSNINVSTYVSAGSNKVLAGTGADSISLAEYLGNPVTNTGDGDAFFSTFNMQRNLSHIDTSQFSINNKALNYGALNLYEVFQNNLLALGYENVDISANGFYPGCQSILHFYKYHGFHIQSLELINKDSFYISGLSSSGSSCAINWRCSFKGTTNTVKIVPVIIVKLSRVLHLKAGRLVFVE